MTLALLGAFFLACLTNPAFAQSVRGRATADVDLTARLVEVEGNAKLTQELLKSGQQLATICASCHGDGGNSVKPDVPNLAGQNPAYLVEQLRQFADGRRRYEFMEGMIKALKSDEKVAIVLFYSRQSVIGHKAEANPALLAKGRDIYTRNCWRCHAQDGHGNGTFARIAGQQPAYLNTALKRYRLGTGTRTNALMAANTKLLSDADIDAVVAYVAALD
jgi:cytochrome c553